MSIFNDEYCRTICADFARSKRELPMNSAGNYDHEKFLHRDTTEKIIGVFYDVYNELGFGYLESIYHYAMRIALLDAGLDLDSKRKIAVSFRGQVIGEFFPDFVVNQKVIVELKAVEQLHSKHEAQLLNYLKSTDSEIGLLLNFGPDPKIKRMVFSNERKRSRPAPDKKSIESDLNRA